MLSKKLSQRSIELIKAASIIAGCGGKSHIELVHILAAISIAEPCIEKALLLKHTKYGYKYVDEATIHHTKRAKKAEVGFVAESVIHDAAEISETLCQKRIEPIHILAAITYCEDSRALRLFCDASIDPKSLRKDIYSILDYKSKAYKSEDTHLKASSKAAKTKMMEKYGIDLTELAKAGKLDPVIARDSEIDTIISVLMRRRKNNACLIGEAGVGKSAIVEGLAIKIAGGDVPPRLKTAKIYSIDIAGIISGTKYRGDFEERLRSLLSEVMNESNVILFFDEMHNLSDAGSAEGAINAANILKPILARSGLKIIGATTDKEYAKHIRPDAALARRFTEITVKEPSEDDAFLMITGSKKLYEQFHSATITPEAIRAAISLSSRYLSERFLPDKAIDLIDEACSLTDDSARCVTAESIETCIKKKLGISINCDTTGLRNNVANEIFGQQGAVDLVCSRMDLVLSGLKDSKRPSASFVFCGPTGCGKTELCRSISKHYLGSAKNMIRLDMSEYQEPSSISKLIGSSAGYVGYGDGGVLTERVAKQPYSLIVFDEAEKAHRSIYTLLLQILEEGELSDSSGRVVNFRNSVVIITTNIGSDILSESKGIIGFGGEASDYKTSLVTKQLESFFSRELMGRIDEVVLFEKLNVNAYLSIAQKEIKELTELASEKGISLYVNKDVIKHIAESSFFSRSGARAIRKMIEKDIKVPLSQKMLQREIKNGSSISVVLDRDCQKIALESVELCFLNDLRENTCNNGSGNSGEDYFGNHISGVVNEAIE